ncbi:MAG: TRAP transporter small permease [Alphaproteobacteria bacterium]
MTDSFERLYQAYGKVVTFFAVLAGMVTFATMWLIDANVLMRKFFNTPVQGSFELTEAGLVLIVFLSLAYTQYKRGHIRVTLLTRHLPIAVQHRLYIIVLFVGALFFAWCSYAAYTNAIRSYGMNEQEWGVIQLPIWPLKSAIVLGTALISVQYLLDAIRHCFVTRGLLPPAGEEP